MLLQALQSFIKHQDAEPIQQRHLVKTIMLLQALQSFIKY